MNATLRSLLDELYAQGLAHDEAQADRLLRRRNLEPQSAELLALTVRPSSASEWAPQPWSTLTARPSSGA